MENGRKGVLKVCHIADIHIRSTQRHDEYRRVFDNLRKDIESKGVTHVWVGGDIFHTKLTGISPEYISLLYDTLRSLRETAEVHLMLGNHDGNLKNLERLDAVSPIVEIMADPRVKLYKDSGVYPITEDANWCVYSPFDPEKWEKVRPEPGKYNIACFHGAVKGAKTATDWELEGEKTVADFKGYDLAMLGDIHKMQFLGPGKRIAYPGSLIQQSYDEDLDHGYLLWTIDLDSGKHDVEFVKIEGSNPFITLRINDKNYKKVVENDLDELKSVRCRVICEDLSSVQKAALKETLSSNDAHEVVILEADTPERAVKKKISEAVKLDSLDSLISQTKSYIDDSIKTSLPWSEIERCIKSYADKLNVGNVKPHRWTLNKFSFDNLYSYSEGNSIDFTDFSGLVGIVGANASGKSSVLGSLLYGLFNSSDRDCTKNAHYINDLKDHASTRCEIDVDGSVYEVVRNSTRSPKDRDASSTKLSLRSLSKNSDMTGEQRNDTDKVIKDLIGSVEDFMMTSMAAQEDMGKFLREGSTSRKEIVSRFLGIDCLSDIHTLAKKDLNAIKSERKSMGVASTVALVDALKKKEAEYKDLLQKLKQGVQTRDELSKEVQQIELQIAKAGSSLIDKKGLQAEIEKLSTLQSALQDQIKSLEKEISQLTDHLDRVQMNLDAIDAMDIHQKMDDAMKMKDALGNAKGQVSLAKAKFDTAEKSSLKLLEVPCAGAFPTCKFIVDSHRDKESLSSLQIKLAELESNVINLDHKLQMLRIDDLMLQSKNRDEFLRQKDKASKDLQAKESMLVSRRDSLTKVVEKLVSLNDQLKTLDETKAVLLKGKKFELSVVQSELDATHSEAGSTKKEIEIIKKQIETCSELDNRQDLFEVIVNTFSKDGFPKYVMSQHMDHINSRMNDVLSKVVDFTVDLRIDDEKGNLDVILKKRGRRRVAELGSGMERTLVSVALRVALREISAIPMPDFFIVDEGFAMLDADNVMACRSLLTELKKMFRFVVVMTHNDVIKEMMDRTIEVSMVGDFSQIDAGKS